VKNKALRAEGEVKWAVDVVLEHTLYRPFKMLAQEPILVLVTLYTSVVYALLYSCRSWRSVVVIAISIHLEF
jgi:hypothetical protein